MLHSNDAQCKARALLDRCPLGGLLGEGNLPDPELLRGLETHNATTPGLEHILVVVVLTPEIHRKLLKLGTIRRLNRGECNAGSVLLVNKGTNTGLGLYNAVGYVEPLAKGGKENNELKGINIVGDDDKLGLLLLNEVCDMLEAELKNGGGSAPC